MPNLFQTINTILIIAIIINIINIGESTNIDNGIYTNIISGSGNNINNGY